MQSYFVRALTLRNENRIDLAFDTLKKATEKAEEMEDVKALADTYHQIAILNLRINKDRAAEFYWDRAKVLLDNLSYPYGKAMHKYIEALFLFKEGKNFQGIYAFNESRKLSNDRNLSNNIVLAEAEIYAKIEKFDSAIKNFNFLLSNNDLYEQDYLKTRGYLGLARVNIAMGDLEESIKHGEQALAIARKNKFAAEILQANELLSYSNEEIGEFKAAIIHQRNIMNIKDSVFTTAKVKAEAKTADKIQYEFMQEEIKRQEAEISDLRESQNRSEITAILTSAFLTIISILAISLYRNNQIKLKTNDLLHTKNKELESARDAAVQAVEAKTNFLSTVSHELRTPLYAVTGLTHLLLEENPTSKQLEHLNALKFSGDYLLNFINDILQINKIDADKLEILSIEFSLKKVLTEVIDSLRQSANQNNTQLILDFDNKIPTGLMSDPIKLSQVFMNLVGNAIKFTKEGQVNIIAKLVEQKDEEATIYFEVKDSGIGISEEKIDSIFDSFEQGSVQINRKYGGTGLGLTIVKSLLGLFESKIEVKSQLGKGSSFFFNLNMKCKNEVVDDTPFEVAKKDYQLAGLHVLVVEDNKINQVITKKMLKKREITCDIANNGYEAIDHAKANRYDAVLMDIHMPGISGDEATKEIRKFDKETPIIALTAISLDDSLEAFYAAGCNDVVTKPFDPEVFYQKIGENIFDRNLKNAAS
ncbi:tetratricopeptide repeat-containing hybrid sensor histidine kinase/response regulator [Sediminicola luteus]|uniref:tetratricopeptide repeat-containing hybrid sensor histidine kinase/response regulator n=1 Tax=Sediminicola luteus TaxID=319238 RepID=UPI001FE39309|nr:response regulator [Sediminicola luteus]